MERRERAKKADGRIWTVKRTVGGLSD
jgi:hypothetical protein